MAERRSSSDFTDRLGGGVAARPPPIGAPLPPPPPAVRRGMPARPPEPGFDPPAAPHLPVFQYPGPQGARPSELAARLRMSKQALNYLLGALERLGYLERQAPPDDQRSRRIPLPARGVATIAVIRDAVAEVEAAWTARLGQERFD